MSPAPASGLLTTARLLTPNVVPRREPVTPGSIASPSGMTHTASPVSRFISKGKGTINRYGLDLELSREKRGQRESCLKAWEVGREWAGKFRG